MRVVLWNIQAMLWLKRTVSKMGLRKILEENLLLRGLLSIIIALLIAVGFLYVEPTLAPAVAGCVTIIGCWKCFEKNGE